MECTRVTIPRVLEQARMIVDFVGVKMPVQVVLDKAYVVVIGNKFFLALGYRQGIFVQEYSRRTLPFGAWGGS